jgi:hypothetical protein
VLQAEDWRRRDDLTDYPKTGGLCRFEFCYSCQAPYSGREGIRFIGNSAHRADCRWHTKNLKSTYSSVQLGRRVGDAIIPWTNPPHARQGSASQTSLGLRRVDHPSHLQTRGDVYRRDVDNNPRYRSLFTTEEWALLPIEEQRRIMRTIRDVERQGSSPRIFELIREEALRSIRRVEQLRARAQHVYNTATEPGEVTGYGQPDRENTLAEPRGVPTSTSRPPFLHSALPVWDRVTSEEKEEPESKRKASGKHAISPLGPPDVRTSTSKPSTLHSAQPAFDWEMFVEDEEPNLMRKSFGSNAISTLEYLQFRNPSTSYSSRPTMNWEPSAEEEEPRLKRKASPGTDIVSTTGARKPKNARTSSQMHDKILIKQESTSRQASGLAPPRDKFQPRNALSRNSSLTSDLKNALGGNSRRAPSSVMESSAAKLRKPTSRKETGNVQPASGFDGNTTSGD